MVGEKKELVAKAYHLGYEVGYYNHIEGVGWVGETHEDILTEASSLKIDDLVTEAYQGGKDDGKKDRARHFLEGMAIPEPISAKNEWEVEIRFLLHQLPKTGALPKMTNNPRFARLPGMLRYLGRL